MEPRETLSATKPKPKMKEKVFRWAKGALLIANDDWHRQQDEDKDED